jgi:FkbM family methyltransferase
MRTAITGFDINCLSPMEILRAETFKTKEPETLAWVDHIKPGEILHDVGANIGIYSLYAASRGIHVYAYEPMRTNYDALCENIRINNFRHLKAIYCAISNGELRLSEIHIPTTERGASGSQIGLAIDEHGKAFAPVETDYVWTMNLWDACLLLEITGNCHIPPKMHVKIDVDGHEFDVCDGMRRLLRSGWISSVLVEINCDAWPYDQACDYFHQFGFTRQNAFNRHPQHSRKRRKGTDSEKAENTVFTRVP